MTAKATSPKDATRPRQSFSTAALHLFTLSAFACAQPLFDILALHAEFFAVRSSMPVDPLLLAFVLIAVAPLPWLAVEALAALAGAAAREAVHLILVALLFGAVLLPPLSNAPGFDGWGGVVAALLAGSSAAAFYARLPAFRSIVSAAGLGVVAFPLLFILDPALRKIINPDDRIAVQSAEFEGQTPVVLIVFDAFPLSSLLGPDRMIDAEMFPNFAELAGDSVWFRNATAVSEHTLSAVPAILTGRYPQQGLHPTVTDHPGNLFTLLQGAYHIEATEDITQLDPVDPPPPDPVTVRMSALLADVWVIYLHVLLPTNLTRSLPAISQSWGNFSATTTYPLESLPASRRSHEFIDFVQSINASSPRTLWFIHTILPHSPHMHYPSGRAYSRSNSPASGQGNHWGLWAPDEWAADQGYQRYLLHVSLVDRLIGILIERLRATGLYDKAVLVVTADHGAAYRAGDEHRGLTETNFFDIMSVPLLVRAPGLEAGLVSDANVQSIDILPTIGALLGIKPTWPVDGISAFDPAIADREEKSFYGDEPLTFSADSMEARYETVSRKIALFGDHGPDRWYRMGPYRDLVGRPVESFRVGREPSIAGRLSEPTLFDDVKPNSSVLPGEIVGVVKRDPGAALPWIAVAVNGVVQAVTRPFEGHGGRDAAQWAAIVAEDAFRPGRNEVTLYSVEGGPGPSAELRVIAPFEGSPQLLGVAIGGRPVWGVREAGFHNQGWAGETPFRWTNGSARLVVPLDPDRPPRELSIELVTTGPEPTELEIKVNGKTLFSGPVPRSAWSNTLPLEGIELGDHAIIQLLSNTFVPAEARPDNMDKRSLGIGVKGVILR